MTTTGTFTQTELVPFTDDRAEGTAAVRGILVGMLIAAPCWVGIGAAVWGVRGR